LGIGIWLAVDQNSLLSLIKLAHVDTPQLQNQPIVIEQAAYLLIAAGAFVFIVSFLGYCGAVKESRVLLGMYGIFVLLIVGLEITAGSLMAVYKPEAEKEIKNALHETLEHHYTAQQQTNAVTVTWDLLQSKLSCCGVNNYTDFARAPLWLANKTSGAQMPESCCRLLDADSHIIKARDPDCTQRPNQNNSFYMKGCYSTIIEYLEHNINIVVGVAVGLGVSQILGIIFAFCLCHAIGNDYIK